MLRDGTEVYTTNELCAITGVPRSRIRNWIHYGRIEPHERISRSIVFWAKWQIEEVLKLKDEVKRGNPNFRRKRETV